MIEYKCSKCGAKDCKLWRDYQTFLEHLRLWCAPCAAENQGKDISDIDEQGARGLTDGMKGRTDQIGWLVPAVPTPAWDTFWAYMEVPESQANWWRNLPTLPWVANTASPPQPVTVQP